MSPPLSLLLPKTFIPFLSFRWPPPTRLSSVVTARTMTSQSNQRVFQLRQDPLTGTSEWIVIDENDEAGAPVTSTDGLLATTSYLDMLNDTRRNRAYRLAIEKTITEPCHVLDIGAGTGLLSMMAARAMGKGMVTACESYLPMVKLMRKVMHKNGMTKNIYLINKRSDELKVGSDIASRADVLLSEILDSELLGEGLIPSLQHAHDVLLVENPKTVPYRATTYCQLVESTFLCNMHGLQSNEARMSDGVRLVPPGLESLFGIKSQQYSMHVDAIEKEIKLLSEPVKIFEFDFWKRPESNGELDVHIEAINEGSVHAIISWWVLQLDSEGTIFYSTAPRWIEATSEIGVRDWCDHWKQCVWFTPGAGVSISKGEKVHLHAGHTCTNILYNLKKTQSLTHETTHSSFSTGDLQLTLPPERVAIYGDSMYRQSIFEATRNALQGKSDAKCLVIDDSLLLPLTALHISNGSRVISLSPGLQESAARYLEAIADSNSFSKDRLEYFREGKAKLTEAYPSKIDLLIGEPYYYGLESGLPWQNLRFWKDRTLLDPVLSKDAVVMPYKGVLRGCAMYLPNLRFWKDRTLLDPVLSKDAVVMPYKGVLRGCAMYLPDLWKSRCCLGSVEGFDHALVNTTLGGCGDLPSGKESPCLPFFVWQCGETKKLSKEFTVMDFDFSKPIAGPCSGEVQIEFTKPGVCHGIALWMDWVMDKENSIVISTGPGMRLITLTVLLKRRGRIGLSNMLVSGGEYIYRKDRTLLDPVLSKDAVVMPYKGVLRGCAMYLPDIWKSRCCLGSVEGFDHALVNTTLGGCGDLPSGKDSPCLPFFVWQCGETKKLSKEFTVMEFDFSKPIAGPCSGEVQIEFTKPGVCHGIALWMDWVMDKENSIVISTGPDERYWKQGVKLLGKPVTVGVEGISSIGIKASLDPSSNGELIITHTLC
ncbi:hypothetical protein F2Q68_00030487 [Brassica cretica]|uniref:Protein arginine N-methyltransferase domain-containing protein n=1 Tax=Brassica cretica TaxID=69181 RepID=A0A8S9GH90_BRACR|nr:hypothetical protein F2Q68_00030487 [Brassica cretica]